MNTLKLNLPEHARIRLRRAVDALALSGINLRFTAQDGEYVFVTARATVLQGDGDTDAQIQQQALAALEPVRRVGYIIVLSVYTAEEPEPNAVFTQLGRMGGVSTTGTSALKHRHAVHTDRHRTRPAVVRQTAPAALLLFNEKGELFVKACAIPGCEPIYPGMVLAAQEWLQLQATLNGLP